MIVKGDSHLQGMAAPSYCPDLMEVCWLPGARIQDAEAGLPDLSGH